MIVEVIIAMATMRRPARPGTLTAQSDQPLIGIALTEGGREVTRYFVDEADADAAVDAQGATRARSLAGAWSDLDWDEAVAELDRIRHDSTPTPPIDDL
jgi:hypothetical protein